MFCDIFGNSHLAISCIRFEQHKIMKNDHLTGSVGVMVRAFASGAGSRGFDPGQDHTTDFKNSTSGYLA